MGICVLASCFEVNYYFVFVDLPLFFNFVIFLSMRSYPYSTLKIGQIHKDQNHNDLPITEGKIIKLQKNEGKYNIAFQNRDKITTNSMKKPSTYLFALFQTGDVFVC
jgi:hypothetical protein